MDINQESSSPIRPGVILLSSPLLTDPNFSRTAVLILDRDENHGHIGLILNRPLDLTLNEICSMPGEGERTPVFNGGPVDLQRLFWLHTCGNRFEGAKEVLPGLSVGGDYNEIIRHYFNGYSMRGEIRFYLGYSGWSAGQLEKEAEAGAWGVLENPLDPRTLLEGEGEEMWVRLVRQLGTPYRHWLTIPSDPNMN